MQYVSRFGILPGKAGAFQAWLAQNEALIRENQPDGWTYLGTWFTVRGLGRHMCEMRCELADYASLGAHDNETGENLNVQFLEFFDPSQPSEVCVMKSASDIYIQKGA